jgi:hypothetical protein
MLVGQQVKCIADSPSVWTLRPVKGEVYKIASFCYDVIGQGGDLRWDQAIQLKELSVQLTHKWGWDNLYQGVFWSTDMFCVVEDQRNRSFALMVESICDIACACGATEQHTDGKLYRKAQRNYPRVYAHVYARAFQLFMGVEWGKDLTETWHPDDIFDAVRGVLDEADANIHDLPDDGSWPFGFGPDDDDDGGKRRRVRPKPKVLT